jgi:hypothetical protein
LIKLLDGIFATRDLAEWRKCLDGNGLVFGVVGILDDLPTDQQMIDNDVLLPFEGGQASDHQQPDLDRRHPQDHAASAAPHRRALGRGVARSRL